ncbi:hypothetical protein HETIRDRAFT_428722 [Heterobasidion irregulare TC 32-1]|uniref:FAD/NAD(P)-binding domain-containing protein n=1 Tax=Heterobasidion irregulare (strain TC 32-1) TaxID=747525 RepID=W4K1N8_HETIT|nr:uncharacterized protein HETIRDRAFT_428722 [Heterobasidion irregulare TC 32-1]ETW79006.1 hypothetical protein HETIRDRAFT_428722 [Heterobasidion irregulare TC 32-1]
MDKQLLEGLRKRGFNLTWELEPGAGEVGLIGFLLQKSNSGTMIDFTCGQSIIDGDIQIKSGVEIDRLQPHELVLSDGSRLPADVVVLATGNLPMIMNATSLFGPRITDKIGNKIWGLDAEGELNNCFRPTGQRGLWIVTGGFQQSRFLSKHLAMQILAEELDMKK